MKVEVLVPDVPFETERRAPAGNAVFGKVLDDVAAVLDKADAAENAFAAGSGDLQNAVYERARADVALSVATAAAGRTAQALESILNMQV